MSKEVKFALDQAGHRGSGKFESPLPRYPGYVKFPDPIEGRHYKIWLRATRKREKADEIDSLTAFLEWQGAFSLIEEWAVDGILREDLTLEGDNVPMDVQIWVRNALGAHLAEQFSPKVWPNESEIT